MAKYIYFEPTNEIFDKLDNYEIMPCLIVGISETGEITYEVCDPDNQNIAIWCVYGHFRTGGVECISDHDSYEEAKDFLETLPKMPLTPVLPF